MAGNTHHETPPTSSPSSCGTTCTPDSTNSTRTNTQPDSYDYRLKLIMVGAHHVRKTSLLQCFTGTSRNDYNVATLGVHIKLKTVQIDGNKVQLQLWDTTGGEKYRALSRSHYIGAHGLMVVFDVTNEQSFKDAEQHWLADIEEQATEGTSILLVGNKCDLTTDRVIDYTTAKEFADLRGIPFMETSAKDGTNVEMAFITLASIAKNIVDSKPKEEQ